MAKPSDRPLTGLNTSFRFMVRNPNASGAAANWGEADLSVLTGLINPVDSAAPTITTPAAFAIAENTLFTVPLTASEPVTWSLVSGAPSPDFAAFVLNGNVLSFSADLDVDYESPDDADGNNSYVITVRATDTAGNTTTKQITVTALDAVELFPPTNSTAPIVTGTPQQGQTLTVSTGAWTNTPSAYAYQWRRNGVPISGAVSSTYSLTVDDVGATITVTVSAINLAGSGSESSSETPPVISAAPVNTVIPAITGTVQAGQTLTVSNGSWTNSPTGYSRQWKRNGVNIANATSVTYVPVTADVGEVLTCTVTATNGGGSTPRTSAATAPVLAAGVALAISGNPTTAGNVGTAYTAWSAAAGGGTAPYTYSVQSGALPAGLTLNPSTGQISGNPTTAGTSSGIVIRVTDSAGTPATADLAAFSIVIAAAIVPLAISGTPGAATVGTPYTFTPAVTGGSGTKSFTLAGTLPAGLSFSSSTGAITGTPTTVGTTSGLDITVTDNSGSAVLSGRSISVASAGGFMLDALSQTAAAAFSLRKLRSAYTGPCIKVRRSSDNLTQDIGFDQSGIIDTAALLAFTGTAVGNAGYIDTWYDQSPAARHAVQPTTTAQPTIVNAGSVITRNTRPIIAFANNQGLPFSLEGGPAVRSMRFVADHRSSANGDLINSSANGGLYIRFSGAHLLQLLKKGGAVVAATTAATALATLSTLAVDTDSTNHTLNIDGGTPVTATSAQTFTAGLTSIFCGSSTSTNGITAFMAFDAILSQADSDAIQASQKAYYGTPQGA